MPTAFAIAAHPDDIEFVMAGTLLLLKEKGWDIHYMNLASGNCGSTTMDSQQTRIVRAREAKRAAGILGAEFHPSICDDLEITYSVELLRRLAATVRQVSPDIVLTHAPADYMEDHMIASRLAVTATFARGMPNFRTDPPAAPVEGETAVYHAMPHGLRDGLRRRVDAGLFVDTTSVHDKKRAALGAHLSQKEWLDKSQGMNSYLITMDDLSLQVGELSGKFRFAEGWRRHLHYGFSAEAIDPLNEVLGSRCLVNEHYESGLENLEA